MSNETVDAGNQNPAFINDSNQQEILDEVF